MDKKLIIISRSLSFGQSLAFSLKAIFGFEEHVIHKASSNLFTQLRAIGIKDTFIIIEDGIPGLNYPALIDDIQAYSPAYQMLLSDRMGALIDIQKMKSLGCGDVISPDVGFKGLINATYSFLLGENPLDFDQTPFARFSTKDIEYLKDVYHLEVNQIMRKYDCTQQNNSAKRMRRFKKLHLNPKDNYISYRVLCQLYGLEAN